MESSRTRLYSKLLGQKAKASTCTYTMSEYSTSCCTIPPPHTKATPTATPQVLNASFSNPRDFSRQKQQPTHHPLHHAAVFLDPSYRFPPARNGKNEERREKKCISNR